MENMMMNNTENNNINVNSNQPTLEDYIRDFYKDGKQLTFKEYIKKIEEYRKLTSNDDAKPPLLPTTSLSKIKQFIKELEKIEDESLIDEDTAVAIADIMQVSEYLYKSDIGCKNTMPETMTNQPTVDNKQLIMKNISAKLRNNNILAVKLKLKEALGIGSNVHVPLWHSGFWVTLEPSVDHEKIKLQLELEKEVDRLGKKSLGLALSNSNVLMYRPLMDYIRSKIIDTSLALPEDEDIFDYISLQDANLLIWGLLQTMYPRGVDYTLYCRYITETKEDGTPVCNYRYNTKIDLTKMLWVDRDSLSVDHLNQMAKRKSKSVTIKEVKEYQESLEANQLDMIKLEPDNETTILIHIKTPTINSYLEYGEIFIDTIRERVVSMVENGKIKSDNTKTEIEMIEFTILNTMYLGLYTHYIDSIFVNGTKVESIKDKNDIIEMISNNPEYRKIVLDKIKEYINRSLVAIIGLPDFTCPECHNRQSTNDKGPFRSFVSINVVDYFFILMEDLLQMILKRSQVE